MIRRECARHSKYRNGGMVPIVTPGTTRGRPFGWWYVERRVVYLYRYMPALCIENINPAAWPDEDEGDDDDHYDDGFEDEGDIDF